MFNFDTSYFNPFSFWKTADDVKESHNGKSCSIEGYNLIKNTLQRLEQAYSTYLNNHFTNASLLMAHQNIEKNGDITVRLIQSKLSIIIKAAYPILQKDPNGHSIDNRDQAVIDTVTNFSKSREQKEKSLKKEETMVLQATKIFSALSSAQNMLNKIIECKKDPNADEEILKMLESTMYQYKEEAHNLLSTVNLVEHLKKIELDSEIASFVNLDDIEPLEPLENPVFTQKLNI